MPNYLLAPQKNFFRFFQWHCLQLDAHLLFLSIEWGGGNKCLQVHILKFSEWDLAEWLERLKTYAELSTVLGSISASTDTVESEGREMKQCRIKYIYWCYFYTWYMNTFWTYILWVPAVEGSYSKRPIKCQASSKILCTLPPLVRGEDTLSGWRVGGGSIFLEDARHCSVLYICKYFVGKGVQWSSNKLTPAANSVCRLHLRN